MRHINLLLLSAFAIFSIGCGGSLTGLAEGVLYPFDQVDKKYPVPENPPEGISQTYFNLKASDGTDMQVHAWIGNTGSTGNKTLVYFHGNGTNLESLYRSNFIGVLQQLKFNFIIIDYPGLGRSTGFPNQPNLVNAGQAALNYAVSAFRGSKIIIWGRSLGAAVATQVAAVNQSKVRGLMLVSPWNRFLDLALEKTGLAKNLPEEWLALHSYDSQAVAPSIGTRTLIHHGLADTLIPHKFGKKLFEAFPQNTSHMVNIEGIGHNDLYTVKEFWDNLKAFNP